MIFFLISPLSCLHCIVLSSEKVCVNLPVDPDAVKCMWTVLENKKVLPVAKDFMIKYLYNKFSLLRQNNATHSAKKRMNADRMYYFIKCFMEFLTLFLNARVLLF